MRAATIQKKIDASLSAEREAVDEISRAFDEDATALAASPYGAAERALHAANDAEEAAWAALLAFPCTTFAEVRAKCAYLAECPRLDGCPLDDDQARALVTSFIAGGANA